MSEPAFDLLLQGLVEAKIRFVMVGGLALNAWGVVRGTKDVDVVTDPAPENLNRLASHAVEIGAGVQLAESFVSSATGIRALLAGGERVLLNTRVGPLDIVAGLPGVPPYADLSARSIRVEILGVEVRVCALEDLYTMKRAAGRLRDLADLEDLDAARTDD